MSFSERAKIRAELPALQREWGEARSRWFAEREELQVRQDGLLIRARDAGMSNSEIADVFSAQDESDREAGQLAATVTTQQVTSMMRDAENRVTWSVESFTRDAFEPQGD